MRTKTTSWITKIVLTTILSAVTGALLPYSVNWIGAKIFSTTSAVVPEDGFTIILLTIVVFLGALVFELVIDIRSMQEEFSSEIQQDIRNTIHSEISSAVNSSFVPSLSKIVARHPETSPAVGAFLYTYFQSLERVSPSKRPIAAKICEQQVPEFMRKIESSLNSGYSISTEDSFETSEYLLKTESRYILIETVAYDWKKYWTSAWHEFANRLREQRQLNKSWICLMEREALVSDWDKIKKIREYALHHGFEFLFTDLSRVRNVLGSNIMDETKLECAEIIGNKLAILWNPDGQGYQGGSLHHARVFDLEADGDRSKIFATIKKYSKEVDSREASSLSREWKKTNGKTKSANKAN